MTSRATASVVEASSLAMMATDCADSPVTESVITRVEVPLVTSTS